MHVIKFLKLHMWRWTTDNLAVIVAITATWKHVIARIQMKFTWSSAISSAHTHWASIWGFMLYLRRGKSVNVMNSISMVSLYIVASSISYITSHSYCCFAEAANWHSNMVFYYFAVAIDFHILCTRQAYKKHAMLINPKWCPFLS